MKNSSLAYLAIFASGVLFALGLGVSQMTRPEKVINFLDVMGNWDPSLALVLVGAVVTYFILHRIVLRRKKPVFSATFSLPARNDVDGRLLTGAVIFGLGWGLGGFCPGPAVTALASGNGLVLLFVGAMVAGMFLFNLYQKFKTTS